jgi:ribosomal protein S18 acetylase RimI-like enzyme
MPERLDCQTVTLRDGAFVELRPIAPEDKSLLLAVFQRLSKESRYRRFSRSFSELPPTLLTYFTEVDHSHREAIIALEPGSGQALGVARYVRLSGDPEAAEVAVAVIDDWQRRGLAPALLTELSRRAHHAGVRRFVALVRADNRDALALFRRTGNGRPRLLGPNFEVVIELQPEMDWSNKRDKPLR